ncbi:UDP-N-acetylmuramate--L-alanine ligase [Striga asiatica]|uniref:UDP-N-acetylmuramate--L-alanine ligase n=1 Tax=Striga asiatica TaxID=4170 RepID=A0A5A7RA77_STRAF|nr:UDP-N-acetylmuramate--L-alanine ligase [Striga asiatica]
MTTYLNDEPNPRFRPVREYGIRWLFSHERSYLLCELKRMTEVKGTWSRGHLDIGVAGVFLSHSFVGAINLIQNSRCQVGQKGVEEGESGKVVFWAGGFKHEGSFLWDDESNCYFSSRGSAQTYCNTQSNAEGSSHTTRGSNYSTTSHAPTNNDPQSVFEIVTQDIV